MENRIKHIRNLRGLTQRELAHVVGVGVPQVSRWEAGTVNIPASQLQAIAEALQCDVDDLLTSKRSLDELRALGSRKAYTDEEWSERLRMGIYAYDRQKEKERTEALQTNAQPFKMEGASEERMREDLPIYGTALGGDLLIDGEAIEQTTLNQGEITAYAKRPVILNGNAKAYALYVQGSSMDPVHLDGDLILAERDKPLRAGDDVVVYLRSDGEGDLGDDGHRARCVLVKRLVRRTGGYVELRQFTPNHTFRVEATDILHIDRVLRLTDLLG